MRDCKREHRAIIEKKIGRKLTSDEIVHHIDRNNKNDDPENLLLTTRAEHARIHKPINGYKFTRAQRKRLSLAHMGIRQKPETCEKIRRFMKQRKITWGDKISKTKSLDLPNEEIIKMYLEGYSVKEIAIRFKVSMNPIWNRLKNVKKRGHVPGRKTC